MSPGAPRILLVDDEPSLLKMMSVYLQRQGYAVSTAASTHDASALATASPHEFAVAVLDASMEGLSMQDLALQLLRGDPRLRVIAASGYPLDMTAIQSEAPGRVMFLHKPFVPEMLAEAVGRMIASQEEGL